ncbi:GntR family transcriptional regulator [Citrobacter amalonaticus]|uniref:GntR family transcriptional regulator n=1 Tax=Citrobacter amalonaticus TaxID=35703 RepID=UPI00300C0D61
MPGLEKLQHISLTTQVEKGLKDRLSIGALRPGTRLITKNIAEELGISITPVREALLRLVSSSALAIAPAQAFMVPDINMMRFNEIIHIRSELEGMAVAAAAGQVTPERMEILQSLLAAYQQSFVNGTTEERLLANRAFRFKIYQFANMPILTELIEQLWVRMGPSLHFLYDAAEKETLRNNVEQYQHLLDRISVGNKEDSCQCLLDIIHENVAIIKQQYIN